MAGISQNDRCRFCHAAVKEVTHLVSGCQTLLADSHYMIRHNKVCRYLNRKMCRELDIEAKKNIWEHEPAPVVSNNRVTIFYNKDIPAGRHTHKVGQQNLILLSGTKKRKQPK